MKAVGEFLADRDYDASGWIVFTRRMGRLSPAAVVDKVKLACAEGQVDTEDGQRIPVGFDSFCIHRDTPGALELIRTTLDRLLQAGITLRALHERAVG